MRIQEGTLTRYRCHTGHGFTAKALLSGVTQTVEDSLWNAVRALEETVMLLNEAIQSLEEGGQLAQDYHHKMTQVQEQLALLRSLAIGH